MRFTIHHLIAGSVLLLHFQAAAGAPPSNICELLFDPEEQASVKSTVTEAIRLQSALVSGERPMLPDADGNPTVDLLEYMKRGMARPILETGRGQAMARFEEAESKLRAAARKSIEAGHKKLRDLNAAKKKEAALLRAQGLPIPPELVQRGYEQDRDGVFITPLARQYPALAQKVAKIASEKTEKLGATDFDVRIAELRIRELKQLYSGQMKDAVNEAIDAAEQWISTSKFAQSPDWQCVEGACREPLQQLIGSAASELGLDQTTSDKLIEQLLRPFDRSRLPFAGIDATTQLPALVVPDIQTRKDFNSALATQEMGPLNRTVEAGVPILEIWHGEGTINSTLDSNKSMIHRLKGAGFHPLAINLPNAGVTSLKLEGLKQIVVYLAERVRFLNERFTAPDSESAPPLIVSGRSMGAAKLYALSLLKPGEPVDAKVMVSFSIPTTLTERNEFLERLIAEELYPPHYPHEIDNATRFSEELMALLGKVKDLSPGFFDRFGEDQLWLQGDNDEDGGENAVDNLYAFQRDYGRLAHVYVFNDPLKNIKSFSELGPESREGTHMLINPKLPDQYFEALAVIWGHLDYMIDEGIASPRLANMRRQRLERARSAQARSLLEAFAQANGIGPAHLERAAPESAEKLERWAFRLKRVQAYWAAEKARCDAIKGR